MMINTGWIPGYLQQTGRQLARHGGGSGGGGSDPDPDDDNDGCFWGCLLIVGGIVLFLLPICLVLMF